MIKIDHEFRGRRNENVYIISLSEHPDKKILAHSIHECQTAVEHYYLGTHDNKNQNCPLCREFPVK